MAPAVAPSPPPFSGFVPSAPWRRARAAGRGALTGGGHGGVGCHACRWRGPPPPAPSTRRRPSPPTAAAMAGGGATTLRAALYPWSTPWRSDEQQADEALAGLEATLATAVAAEDFGAAATARDAIAALGAPSVVRVFQTSMRLYAAIDAGDVASVAAAWARSPAVVYVGALRPPAVGYEAVVGAMAAEWEEGGVPVTSVRDVRVVVRGVLAWCTAVEVVTWDGVGELPTRSPPPPGLGGGAGGAPGRDRQGGGGRDGGGGGGGDRWSPRSPTEVTVLMQATNVFEAKNGEWYLIARMATPLSAAGGGAS